MVQRPPGWCAWCLRCHPGAASGRLGGGRGPARIAPWDIRFGAIHPAVGGRFHAVRSWLESADGRTDEALATYGRVRRNLVEDHGIEHAPRLQRLQHAILTHAPARDGCGADQLVGVNAA
ncbi:BTAD domain-containing putative transcriptional regulator [Streptomyces sp. NPDC048257]|uniref:BTAD domain-containing putative transcriptional regulator n=1 Tax=Streptomyces sp. NPDC048257 TaxID=3365526 RepID=UPI00371F9366